MAVGSLDDDRPPVRAGDGGWRANDAVVFVVVVVLVVEVRVLLPRGRRRVRKDGWRRG